MTLMLIASHDEKSHVACQICVYVYICVCVDSHSWGLLGDRGGKVSMTKLDFTQKMVLQSLLMSYPAKFCRRQSSAIWSDSFTQKMVLKRPVISYTDGSLLITFIVQVSWNTEDLLTGRSLWISIDVLKRWSWKGQLLVTVWRPLCIYLGLPADRSSAWRQFFELVELKTLTSEDRWSTIQDILAQRARETQQELKKK